MTGSATPQTPRWRKSTYSGEVNCVELAELPDGTIGIRHSTQPAELAATFTRTELAAFFQGVKAGEFDDLT